MTIYINDTKVNRTAMRGYDQVVTARTYVKLRPWDGELDHKRMHVFGPNEDEYGVIETLGVPTPRPGRRVPGPGHWRTSADRRPVTRPRVEPRPTGGKIADRSKNVKPPKRRKRVNKPTSAATHHARWAKAA